MYRNPILIRNIYHLTDARYFAAMGVDWMSMHLTNDDQTFAMWHTLADWIEGVRLAAEVDGSDEMLLAKAIIEAKPNGIVTQRNILEGVASETTLFLEVDTISESQDSANVFYLLPYESYLKKGISDEVNQSKVFLVADWTSESVKDVLSKGFSGGFCFSGGEEEEVGMRDYEQMDELLELLQGE